MLCGVAVENHHPSERCQSRILLNADSIFSDRVAHPLDAMMATLLPEMCHAYHTVRCYPTREQSGGDEYEHDEHFETIVVSVHERAMWTVGLGAISEGEPFRKRHFQDYE